MFSDTKLDFMSSPCNADWIRGLIKPPARILTFCWACFLNFIYHYCLLHLAVGTRNFHQSATSVFSIFISSLISSLYCTSWVSNTLTVIFLKEYVFPFFSKKFKLSTTFEKCSPFPFNVHPEGDSFLDQKFMSISSGSSMKHPHLQS